MCHMQTFDLQHDIIFPSWSFWEFSQIKTKTILVTHAWACESLVGLFFSVATRITNAQLFKHVPKGWYTTTGFVFIISLALNLLYLVYMWRWNWLLARVARTLVLYYMRTYYLQTSVFCPSVFPYPVPPIEENVLDEGKLLKPWDTKKVKTLKKRFILLLAMFSFYFFN